MSEELRVAVIDPHWAVVEGLRRILAREAVGNVVAEYRQFDDSVSGIRSAAVDVVVFEPMMQPGDAAEAVRKIRDVSGAAVLILTSSRDGYVVRASVRAGAAGYLTKDAASTDIAHAVRAVAKGCAWLNSSAQRQLMALVQGAAADFDGLSRREQMILELICEGLPNKEIAARTRLAEGTVKTYISRIISKFGLSDRTQVALHAIHNGLVDTSSARRRLSIARNS